MHKLLPQPAPTEHAMRIAGALTAALPHIATKKEQCYTVNADGEKVFTGATCSMFICLSMNMAGVEEATAKITSQYLHHCMTLKCGTFNTWTEKHFPEKFHTWENVQRLRRIWIKKLIKELQYL
jgi:hypothetical protein